MIYIYIMKDKENKLNELENYLSINSKLEIEKLNRLDNRIKRLIKEISIINNQNEYFRLKYYKIMIYKIDLLKSLLNEKKEVLK